MLDRHQHLDRVAAHLLAGEAEHPFRREVAADDQTVVTDDHDAVGRAADDGIGERFAFAQTAFERRRILPLALQALVHRVEGIHQLADLAAVAPGQRCVLVAGRDVAGGSDQRMQRRELPAQHRERQRDDQPGRDQQRWQQLVRLGPGLVRHVRGVDAGEQREIAVEGVRVEVQGAHRDVALVVGGGPLLRLVQAPVAAQTGELVGHAVGLAELERKAFRRIRMDDEVTLGIGRVDGREIALGHAQRRQQAVRVVVDDDDAENLVVVAAGRSGDPHGGPVGFLDAAMLAIELDAADIDDARRQGQRPLYMRAMGFRLQARVRDAGNEGTLAFDAEQFPAGVGNADQAHLADRRIGSRVGGEDLAQALQPHLLRRMALVVVAVVGERAGDAGDRWHFGEKSHIGAHPGKVVPDLCLGAVQCVGEQQFAAFDGPLTRLAMQHEEYHQHDHGE